MKLWEGRLKSKTDQRVNDFNSSISVDARMVKQDVMGSIAHVQMLSKQGVLPIAEAEAIEQGLSQILSDILDGTLEIDPAAEDIHTFIEGELTNRIGDAGKRLHTARSRNDQVALDLRLYLRDDLDGLEEKLKALIFVLLQKAEENLHTIMPGYTHLQHAQPVTFAHHMMAYVQMFLRDMGRFLDAKERMNASPLGSGALAGTTYPIDRKMVADALYMDGATLNSLDGVSDRDFAIEIASAVAICMMHLSRLSEEIILWVSDAFHFIELDDAFATGSSIMPQKKNPDVAELIRGKTGRVYGDVITLLTMMKGLPLAYNKDMQEDKEAIFDALDTLSLCLITMAPMVETMKVCKGAMEKAAKKGYMNATDCADYLTKKGVPFRDAYKVVGQIVQHCIVKGIALEDLDLGTFQTFSPVFEGDIYQAISLETCVSERKSLGGPAASEVKKQIEAAKQALG